MPLDVQRTAWRPELSAACDIQPGISSSVDPAPYPFGHKIMLSDLTSSRFTFQKVMCLLVSHGCKALAGAHPGAAPPTRADLWQARPPPAVHAGVWQGGAWQPSQSWTAGSAACTLGCTAQPSPLPTSLTLLAPPALRWPASGSLGNLLACAACLVAGAPPAPWPPLYFLPRWLPPLGPSTGQQWPPPPHSSDCSPPGVVRCHSTLDPAD